MQQTQLLEALRELQGELAQLDKIDPQTAAALEKVNTEVDRLLDPNDPTAAADVDTSSDGLRGYLLELEAEHPRLASLLGQLADGLASMGI
ncbi:MAG: DUF4404 family protein [Planctomycetota bacterium]